MTFSTHIRPAARAVLSAGLILTASCLVTACTLASEPVPAGPIQTGPLPGESLAEDLPASLPRASEGAVIFEARCAACHGLSGVGDGEFAAQLAEQGAELPDLSDLDGARSRSPQAWYLIITNGTIIQGGLMPPWADTLTDAQRWDVASYLYELSADPEMVAEGAALFEATCSECHGADAGPGPVADFRLLATMNHTRLIDNFIANPEDSDHDFGDLSEEEQAALAAYLRTLGYDGETPAIVAEDEPLPVEPGDSAGDAAAASGDRGTVSGVVTNDSAGGVLPDDLTVGLRGVTLDKAGGVVEFLSRTTEVDEEGGYVFEDVPFDREESAYLVSVVRDGVEFRNGVVIEPGAESLDLPLTIYEVTTDPAVVRINAMSIIVRALPDSLLVAELVTYSNDSDAVYATEQYIAGGRRGGVSLSLPVGADAVAFENQQIGVTIFPVGDHYQRLASLAPGERSDELLVTYLLDFAGGREIVLPIEYQTDTVNLLVDESLRVRGDDFTPAGSETIEGAAFDRYVANDLDAGSTIRARLAPRGLGRDSLALMIGVLVVGATVGYGVYLLFLRRPAPASGSAATAFSKANAFSPAQMALLKEIAALDEGYEAGEIRRLEYEAQRAELKARVAEMGDG